MQKLDRVLDSDNVVSLCLIDPVDDGRKRRTLSRTGRTRKQHNAIPDVSDLGEHRRHSERLKTRDLMRNDTHHDRIRVTLLKNIYPKAAFA